MENSVNDGGLKKNKASGESVVEVRESKCPFLNKPKIIKLNRLEEFCAALVWNA